MASACVNNIDCAPAAFPPYGWRSPGISFSREYSDDDSKQRPTTAAEVSDPSKEVADFEFRLDDTVTMLPADELFSDGKLMPLQLTAVRPAETDNRSEAGSLRGGDPYLFSPKAPRCSSRWRELLGFKKLYQNNDKAASSSSSTSTTTAHSGKSIRQFLLRNTKSLPDAYVNLPLLKDTSDYESLSVSSSRLSLSSSSSGHDYDDLHRQSVDSDSKNSQSHIPVRRNSTQGHPRLRMVKARPLVEHPAAASRSTRRAQQDGGAGGISVDSPRMSSSGKVVFQSLGRSSSSPSRLNGGGCKLKGMERSYSAHVRVTNVPVCSLRGASNGVFGFFSKKEVNNHRSSRAKRGAVGEG